MNASRTSQLPIEVQDVGRTLVLQFLAVLRTLQLYGPGHVSVTGALEGVSGSVNTLLSAFGTSVSLQFIGDILLLNTARVHTTARLAEQFAHLGSAFSLRGLGGISFSRPPEVEILRRWFVCFSQRIAGPADVQRVHDALILLAPSGVESLAPGTFSGEEPIEMVRAASMGFAQKTYARAVIAFHCIAEDLKTGREPFRGRLNLTRIAQDLVDISCDNASLLLKILELRAANFEAFRGPGASYHSTHAAHSAIYATLIGRFLGLDRLALLDLALAALFADIGFAVLPEEWTARENALRPDEKLQLRLAMVRAVQALLAAGHVSEPQMRRVIVAYEHHRPYILPSTKQRSDLHVSSRIVAVADAYDALTSHRTWRPALPPREAIEMLRRESGTRFDPALVEALAAVIRDYMLYSRPESQRAAQPAPVFANRPSTS